MTSPAKGSSREHRGEDKGQLANIMEADRLIDDPAILEDYSRDMSFAAGTPPLFVVKPEKPDEIVELVRWANETRTPLVPVSSGPPHLRGDTLPEQSGVVVDLSDMKQVLRIDRRNRVAMLEPGVTFADVKPELDKNGMRAMFPLAPRISKSIIGSYLEREPILVPRYHWDMSDPLCCTEVVFGNGDLFRTGAAAGPGTLEEQWEAGQAQKSPVGPGPTDFLRVLQGAQGTMGIVTWATIRLELLPSIQELFMVPCDELNDIIDFVYRLQRLKLGDECLVLDRLNLAAILETDAEAIRELSSVLPPYVLIFVIAGYHRLPEERVDYQTKDVFEIARGCGIEPVRALQGMDTAKLLQALMAPCAEPYWKLRYRGSSADVFFLTTLNRCSEFAAAMSEAACEAGFPLSGVGTYIQPIQQGRACHMEFNLFFDPEDRHDAAAAERAFETASRTMMMKGAFFSRPYGLWSAITCSQNAEHVIAQRKVKRIFDPHNVMNPGKLFF